ncbi:MAG: dihydroneopterin aldolase [Planctomycetes bacterium]|nr:dihydroneopterin aldolase [Planctomycetota bacterium]
MDRIHIGDLALRCIIGILPEERRELQDVLINVTMAADLQAAGRSDDLADSVDYKAIKQRIRTLVEGSRFRLIESLAERIAATCLEDPRVRRVRVRVDKPGALRFARTVAVEVSRTRKA